jgi:hypothetical protein
MASILRKPGTLVNSFRYNRPAPGAHSKIPVQAGPDSGGRSSWRGAPDWRADRGFRERFGYLGDVAGIAAG